MRKCPHCNKEISSLEAVVYERNLYTYRDDSFGAPDSILFDILRWKCPKCGKKLPVERDTHAADEWLAGRPK